MNVDDPFPGSVGKRHKDVPFDPARRNAWKQERGRILTIMWDNRPVCLLGREIWRLDPVTRGSANQTCSRIDDLHKQGLVRRTGRQRLTETNSPADEWELTADGLALFGVTPPPPPAAPSPRRRVIRRKP